jgi:formimidoylglutamate deiminase
VPHGSREGGWLPDCVLMGDKVESGLAFFADAQGRITRFSREPADLAAARRLAGQVALPGLVNAHSHAVLRVLRGRTEPRGRTEAGPGAAWRQAHDHALDRLGPEDVFDAARMTFMEMLLAGITCVGEFHYLHQGPAGAPALEPGRLSREVMRAAHDVGIRIALLHVAHLREDGGPAPARSAAAGVDAYLKDLSALQEWAGREYAADEVWVGAAPHSLAAVPPDAFKAIALHARAQRLRLHTHLPATPAEQAAAVAQCGRPPVAFLADQGLVDKRFTAVDAAQLGEDEIRLLGTARATVCVCPGASQVLGLPLAAVDRLLTAGAGVAWGSDAPGRIDAFEDARLLEFGLRSARGQRPVIAPDAAQALLHALTVTGARSLGATGGALEVGRPADFFTVNLFDPLLAGADAGSLPAQVVFGLDRRAVRDVWVGARQRISHGRHVGHGPIVGRFVDLQKRLWPSP